MMRAAFLLICISLLLPDGSLFAQNWGTLEGRILQSVNDQPIPGATVVVNGTNFGTAADESGFYTMRLPARMYQLVFRAVGIDGADRQRCLASDQPERLQGFGRVNARQRGRRCFDRGPR